MKWVILLPPEDDDPMNFGDDLYWSREDWAPLDQAMIYKYKSVAEIILKTLEDKSAQVITLEEARVREIMES